MTGNGQWSENGLGETGESYLVGPDRLMRSASRLFLEDEEAYYTAMAEYGISDSTRNSVNNFGTTILVQPVAGDGVDKAFGEQTGTHISTNYLGQSVLSSYAPIKIPGLNWIILSEMTEFEAFTPIFELQRNILIWGVVLVLIVAFLAVVLSRYFVRPIEKLTQGVQALSAGAEDVHINIESNDEFGDLARNFNTMVDSIRAQSAIIEEKSLENERLLLNILPAPIAERLQAGERIADHLQQVSVIYIHMLGFSKLSRHIGAEESANHLDSLINLLDDAAERYEVERVRTIGDTYVAACGLTTARLDHAKRTVDFAVTTLRILQRYNMEQDVDLKMQIGIDSGPVISGVVGAKQFNFEIWGETIDVAGRIHTEATPDTILITQDVLDRVSSYFDFIPTESILYHTQTLNLYQLSIDDTNGRENGHRSRVEQPELQSEASGLTTERVHE